MNDALLSWAQMGLGRHSLIELGCFFRPVHLPNSIGLLSSLLGNASEIDIPKVQQELAPVLVPGETIGNGRDMFIFTDHRLILIDKQGLTGSNAGYRITSPHIYRPPADN